MQAQLPGVSISFRQKGNVCASSPPHEMAITMMNLRGCICSRPKATDITSTATEVNALSLRKTWDQLFCHRSNKIRSRTHIWMKETLKVKYARLFQIRDPLMRAPMGTI